MTFFALAGWDHHVAEAEIKTIIQPRTPNLASHGCSAIPRPPTIFSYSGPDRMYRDRPPPEVLNAFLQCSVLPRTLLANVFPHTSLENPPSIEVDESKTQKRPGDDTRRTRRQRQHINDIVHGDRVPLYLRKPRQPKEGNDGDDERFGGHHGLFPYRA